MLVHGNLAVLSDPAALYQSLDRKFGTMKARVTADQLQLYWHASHSTIAAIPDPATLLESNAFRADINTVPDALWEGIDNSETGVGIIKLDPSDLPSDEDTREIQSCLDSNLRKQFEIKHPSDVPDGRSVSYNSFYYDVLSDLFQSQCKLDEQLSKRLVEVIETYVARTNQVVGQEDPQITISLIPPFFTSIDRSDFTSPYHPSREKSHNALITFSLIGNETMGTPIKGNQALVDAIISEESERHSAIIAFEAKSLECFRDSRRDGFISAFEDLKQQGEKHHHAIYSPRDDLKIMATPPKHALVFPKLSESAPIDFLHRRPAILNSRIRINLHYPNIT